MTSGKTISELLQNGIEILNNTGIENANLDARAFLCHILNKDRIYLDIHKNDIIDSENANLYMNYIERRKSDEPFAYIINSKEFMSLDFYVDKNVLIPRPDTEILVEYVIDYCKKENRDKKIIDLCTGSGAIAVSIAKYVQNCNITGVDISDDALNIAFKNSHNHKVDRRVLFEKFDVLDDISKLGKFDVVVSNPPYIRKKDVLQLDNTVKDYEPLLALDGGEDGLIFYRNIIKHAPKMLNDNGIIALEIGFDQADDVTKMLKDISFKNVSVLKDYSGNDRVVIAKK